MARGMDKICSVIFRRPQMSAWPPRRFYSGLKSLVVAVAGVSLPQSRIHYFLEGEIGTVGYTHLACAVLKVTNLETPESH